jgi:hypothetical protein
MKKTPPEVEQEIAKLKSLRGRIPQRSIFGNNNLALIQTQIEALSEGWSEDDVLDRMLPQAEEDAAMFAVLWREGTSAYAEDSPSGDWEPIARKENA